MSDLPNELNAILRYSMDTVENLMTQLQQPEYQSHRWGNDDPLGGLRGVLADALEERDRNDEAHLLRTPNQHVMVVGGKVQPAKFTTHHFDFHLRKINQELGRLGFMNGLVAVPTERSPNYSDDKSHITLMGDAEDYPYTHHPSEFGKEAVAHIANSLPDEVWETEEGEGLDRHLSKLKNAPYEEIDADHPFNRQKGAN